MNILHITEINNDLENFPVSYIEIESQIQMFSLKFYDTRNRQIEWNMELPMFVTSFYEYIKRTKGKIPNQEEYWESYIADNKIWFKENPLSVELFEGLRARVFRTYPSLIRDIHFAKYLEVKLSDICVIYNTKLDILDGIDLLLIHNGGKLSAINLYADTRRAYIGRQKKIYRHKNYTNVNYIELPVAFRGSIQIGDFFLYGKREKEKIQNLI